METKYYLWTLLLLCFLPCRAQQDQWVALPGDGTSESPYLIASADDLVSLSRATNELGLEFDGKLFLITDDIDLAAVTDFEPLSQNPDHPFNGIIEAEGHCLKGWTVRDAEKSGFICWLGPQGSVSGIVIDESCRFLNVSEFAPLVYCAYGSLNNCVNRAAIHGAGAQAGIVYLLEKGQVESCYNEGNIYGGPRGYAAGVVGVNRGTIVRSENVGCVRAMRGADVGGIAGENHGVISNCVSAGSLAGYNAVGGLAAVAKSGSEIGFSLCTAVLKNYADYSRTWAIVGFHEGDQVAFHEVYYDFQVSVFNKEGSKSIWPKLTRELVYDTWPGSRAWTHLSGEYPRIYRNSHYPSSFLMAQPVIFAEGDSRLHVTQPAQLAQADGLQWSVEGGNGVFEIDGSSLLVHPAETYSAAILRATFKGLTKEIVISNLGSGFNQPNVEDWWMVKSSSDFNGDGKTDVADMNRLINAILKLEGDESEYGDLDVKIDGKIDVEDINDVINRILGF